MLLYEEDWTTKYPYAVVHMETKNESFLRYAALLKSMGVKNYKWCLALFDKDLRDVDPFDPNLSTEMILKITLECRNNYAYYIREVARSPDGDEDYPIRFKAHRGNMALYWLYWNHVETMLIQIRQTGKSFAVDYLDNYLMNIRCKKTEIHLLTKDETLRASNLNRLKKIESMLPFYLKQRTRWDVGNSEMITVKALENIYRGHLPNKSPKEAEKVGRGLTSGNFRVDEVAYFSNIGISLQAALAAGTMARNIARMKGEPYGVILTTTAGKKDDRDGGYAYSLMAEAAVWSEMFMDATNEAHLYEIIRHAAPGVPGRPKPLRVNCTFNHRQLGFTDEWLRDTMIENKSEGDMAERDFLNRWTSGGISSPLSIQMNERIRDSQQGEYYTEISKPYSFVNRWYVSQQSIQQVMTESHIMAIDSSDAIGKDDIGVVLRSVKTGSIVMAGNYNEINLLDFGRWVAQWLIDYPSITLIIERRSSGMNILDTVARILEANGIDPFRRIYNRVVQDADEKPDGFKEINGQLHSRRPGYYDKMKSMFGFATSAQGATSRTDLYSNTLQNAAQQTGHLVKDKVIIEQILSLEIRNGRVDHKSGQHDDLVISWLLSYWLMLHGRNLQHYGINPRDILIDNQVYQKDNSPMVKYNQNEQNFIKAKIDKLVNEIKNERDEFVVQRLEADLSRFAAKLTADARQTLSVSELIDSLREQRKHLKRQQHYNPMYARRFA